MARDLALDPRTRDLKWPLQFISGKAEIQQALTTLLMTPKGTFLNYPEVGMDNAYLNQVFNPEELRLAVTNCLKEDKRVTQVNKVNLKYSKNRKVVTVYINVSTTLGTIDFSKEMNSNAS